LKRAVKLFSIEERRLDSPVVERVWRTRSGAPGDPAEAFTSVAVPHWQLAVRRQRGRTYVSVRGPETKATTALIPAGTEFFGIDFKLGSFTPILPVPRLVDGMITLPEASRGSFWLHGAAWQVPDYDNADVFVQRLVRQGLLVRDPVVEDALAARVVGLSPRSVQLRVRRATGLTQSAIRQIERAEQAVELLDSGTPILDAVRRAGYADQAHMTRALRRFVGQTPGEIVRE
jgi:AraC-like DNA-binding protein